MTVSTTTLVLIGGGLLAGYIIAPTVSSTITAIEGAAVGGAAVWIYLAYIA